VPAGPFQSGDASLSGCAFSAKEALLQYLLPDERELPSSSRALSKLLLNHTIRILREIFFLLMQTKEGVPVPFARCYQRARNSAFRCKNTVNLTF
jgi:hypothetical protein